MNNKNYFITTCILFLCFLSSCVKENMENRDSGSQLAPDGKVLLSFYANVPVPHRIQTKATPEQEDEISNVYVLVFDANSKLSQAPVEAISAGVTYKAALVPGADPQNIYVLANLSSGQKSTLNTFIPGQTTYDDCRTALVSADVTASGIAAPFAMCSNVIQSVISPSMGGKTAVMERAVARIDANAATLNSTLFTLESVTLLNASKKGSILPGADLVPMSGTNVVRYNEQLASANQVVSAVYCYENGGMQADHTTPNPTRLLVKGRYQNGSSGYYLLNVVYKQPGDPDGIKRYDIKRNFIYTVNITGVSTPGYSSEAEALANSPTNDIAYNVTVTDPDSHDIVSNGDYYLGFSNSDCLLFSSEEASNITIAVLTHSAPASITTRTVSVTGTELTLVGNPLSVNANTPSPVIVNIGRNFSNGTLAFRLGNLVKTITIERRENSMSFGGVLDLGPDYVLGEILHADPFSESWLKFSESQNAVFAEGTDKIVNTDSEEVYVVFEHNIITIDGTSRNKYEEAYLSKTNESGRTKAIFFQHPYNMIKLDGKPVQDTYVATFHRNNETGERIIKMQNPQTNGLWIVEVVAGKDFIKIAPGMNPVPDPGLYTDNFGNAEDYQVEGNATQLIGTDNMITFRVGLKGTIAETENRYGLILITHALGSNRIFVRQGQAPDYIMRDIDPINPPASITSPNRPNAVMFSPFNLTDPQGRTGRVDLSGGQAGFTQYPSQSGYLFQAFNTYGWYPYGSSPENWISSLAVVRPWNLCPDGYRMPMDGPDNSTAGDVSNSEMRQSLWYNPKTGDWSSDYENILRGFMADGFYDRQPLIKPVAGNEFGSYAVNPSVPCVANSGAQIAVCGQVIFNPTTFASIFVPAAGFRNTNSSGQLRNVGIDANLWSGTYTATSTWSAAMVYWGGNFTFDTERITNSYGFSLRCVKKKPGEP